MSRDSTDVSRSLCGLKASTMSITISPSDPKAVQRTNRLRRLIEYRLTTDRTRLPRQSREHLQILDLIEAGDMQAAADFLFRHVREAGRMKAAQLG